MGMDFELARKEREEETITKAPSIDRKYNFLYTEK